jgi:hypothetical protein
VTKTGTNLAFYLDGFACSTTGYARTFTFVSPAALGARGDTLTNSFLGTLDEISAYSRPLAPEEILALYTAGMLGKCSNHAPIATDALAATLQNLPLSIPAGTLLLMASDPDGDSLTLSAVSPASTNGGSVTLVTNTVIYTPATDYTGADRFTYAVSDSHGGIALAIVLVQIRADDHGAGNLLTPQVTPGGLRISFAALPGRTYSLERAESVTGPWTSLSALTVGPLGIAAFTDIQSSTNAFYRLVLP